MRFIPTNIFGAYLIEMDQMTDERGFFARSFCADEFNQHGLTSNFVQCNVSFTSKQGSIRGLHYQIAPDQEAKLVRCTKGAICDVILDLRPGSPTFKQWMTAELTADNHQMLYLPMGCAHGFQTLVADTEVCYQVSAAYQPESARGVRWNDPAFGIKLPLTVTVINDRDRNYPDFEDR